MSLQNLQLSLKNSEHNTSNSPPNNTTVSFARSQESTFPALNNTTIATTEEKATVMPPHQSNKRLLPSSTGSTTSSTTAHSTKDTLKIAQPKVKQSRTAKKPKVANSRSVVTSAEVEAQLDPAKAHIISKVPSYPLSHEDLVDFLVTTYGKSDIPAIAKHFTVDAHLLINMLEETNSHLLYKNLIHRIRRIIIRLSSNEKSSLSDTLSERSIDNTEDSNI